MSDKIQTDCVCHNSNGFPFANEIITIITVIIITGKNKDN